MPTKAAAPRNKRARARTAAAGDDVRQRVRDLSIKEFRDRNLSRADISRFVNDMLDGAVQGVDESIPKSTGNVLRQVFDGLSEGVNAVASAGSAAATGARKRGQAIVDHDATRRVRAANQELLDAVRAFAGRTSAHVRDELQSLVDRAERTAPKVSGSARRAAQAADGRLLELSGETARAGVRAVRRAAGALAMGAGGLFEGLAESISPRRLPTPAKRSKGPRRAPKSSKGAPRTSKKAAKKATKKKTVRQSKAKRSKA